MAEHPGPDVCTVIEQPRNARVILLRAVGDIDMLTTPTVRTPLIAAINRYRHVVLDLGDVRFLGSSGLQLLVEANAAAEADRHTLYVAGAARAVLRPLQISGIDKVLVMTDQPADALADALAGEPEPA